MVVGRQEERPAVFLDRDGVIVVPEFRDGRSFAPTRLEDFHLYPESLESLTRLKDAGFLLVVVTNQPDVGKGVISRELVDKMHDRLSKNLPLDAIKACFHTKDQACACRKPRPGMLIEAGAELGVSFERSFMVGDRASDVEAGEAVGCRTVFIDLDYAAEPKPTDATFVVKSLREATDAILGAGRH